MNNNESVHATFEKLMASQRAIWQQLKAIGETLDRLLALTQAQAAGEPLLTGARAGAPNLRRPLRAYPAFDWASIGAEVVSEDEHGAIEVVWRNEVYTRRTKPKFGADVWFSRGDGQGEDGRPAYDRLITFVAPRAAAEPLPDQIARALKGQGGA